MPPISLTPGTRPQYSKAKQIYPAIILQKAQITGNAPPHNTHSGRNMDNCLVHAPAGMSKILPTNTRMPLSNSRRSRGKEDHALTTNDHDHHPKTTLPGQAKGNREGFSSSLGVIAATLGSAVGLGNIWKFPYETGLNGGAAFIFIYLACVFLVSLPVMLSELIIGRKAKANAVRAFKILEPRQPWYLIGVTGALSSFLIMAFYTEVAGWVYAYIFKAATGQILSTNPEQTGAVFKSLATGIWQPLIWQWLVLAVIGAMIMAGVTKGIERVTKTLMPVLFLFLLIIDIRSLTLPGASQGLKFLFQPDFSKVGVTSILVALGLSFFKLSVGIGTMTTYGSYMGPEENLPKTAIKVALADTLVSLMAGIAIFPAVFAFGVKPDSGPSLLFVTIPTVFTSMPLGTIFMVLFFILVSIAATGAMLSLLEVPVAYLVEERHWTRPFATLAAVIGIALVGSTSTLSPTVLSAIKPFGLNFFDLYDFLTSNIFMPVGGITIAVFLGWRLKATIVREAISNSGAIRNNRLANVFLFLVRYVAPVAIVLILLSGLGIIR